MVHARKTARTSKTAQWLGRAAIGLSIGIAHASLAFGQGGQTEVTKTMPSNPHPAPAAPAAPANPAPAISAQAPITRPASPAASPTAWQADAQPAAADQENLQIVAKVNDYFNKLTDLQGEFIQTDPDNRRKRGQFYFQRPGKARFEYTVPSNLKIISDGSYIAIEDHSANTSERYPLDVTPFRLLLTEKVDLAADAKIVAVEQGADTYIVTVEDKKGDSSGRIRLFFNKADMSLKEWIITDAQGLDTRMELANVELGKKVADSYFQYSRFLGLDHDR
jgi:outer membrane lipoprotein-sorting protein